jgi:hypothetical protein
LLLPGLRPDEQAGPPSLAASEERQSTREDQPVSAAGDSGLQAAYQAAEESRSGKAIGYIIAVFGLGIGAGIAAIIWGP